MDWNKLLCRLDGHDRLPSGICKRCWTDTREEKRQEKLLVQGYDPAEYWRERGKTYYQENFDFEAMHLQEKMLIETLRQLSFSSVLEAGCGFGRITKLILDNFPSVKEYSAFDLSPDQIENAKKHVNNSKVNFSVSDIRSFQTDEKYDLVIAAEVLLHVKPADLKGVILKLLSMSNHYLVHVDASRDKPPAKPPAPYNFLHNYQEVYQSLGLSYAKEAVRAKKSIFKTIDAHQAIFVVSLATQIKGNV